MINLLPDNNRKEIHAGYANYILIRYIFMVFIAIIVLASIIVMAYVVQLSMHASAEERVASAEKDAARFSSTVSESEKFKSNLATAKQILDKEVKYSKLILMIAEVLPKGVYIDSLTLDSKSLGTPITLSAHTKTMKDAVNLKSRFENNKKLFSDVHFQSITPQETSDNNSGGSTSANTHPIQVLINVTINKGVM
ncbi:hypothetical protein KC952_01545 [Candidatus Saccharibacteria bacterium]|nr:hypothetical protein [Candidatus Saccharibacteria bacterium]